MIINIKVNNSYVFASNVELSLNADMRQKKFGYNVYSENNFNVLKSIGIYGPNNVGKTCLLKSIRNIRNVILNKNINLSSNIFNESNITELGVTFLEAGKKYAYDFKYNTKEKEFIYEKFVLIERDDYGNEKPHTLLLRDSINKEYFFEDKSIENMMKLTSKSNILIHLIDEAENKHFEKVKSILISFASKIDYVDMNNIPIKKTIDLLKNKDNMQDKIVNFIVNSDLDMENFKYNDNAVLDIKINDNAGEKAQEKALDIPDRIMDQIRLTSVYKGKSVSSMLFDSTGTKKIIALSSYIIEALEKGRILIIDELDSSIHFKLARAIVSMFNNELNRNAQLIFSVHDINLMDCKKLFRKEQIWFIHKDEEGVYLYSLSDFTASDGVRDTTNIIEKYKKGFLGAVPDPNLINTLLEVSHD
jgi:AAA15 family ATPase/GTPase